MRYDELASEPIIYSYNGQGQRVRKFSSSGSSSTVLFAYGLNGELLGEYDSTGTAIREYVWLDSTPIAMFTPDTVATNPPIVFYFYTDHLNTPRVVTDTAGNIRWRWMAEPFGTTAPETNPSGLGAFTQPLRFPGQYADAESGLFYNYFRNYDSTTGRYNTSDPIGLDGGVNTYAYVEENPLQGVDPNGLVKWSGSITITGFNYKKYLIPIVSAASVSMTLESECVGGKKVKVTLDTRGKVTFPGMNISAVAFRGHVKDLDDGKALPDKDSLVGDFKFFLSGVGYGSGETLQSGAGTGGKVSGGGMVVGSYLIQGTVVRTNYREDMECTCP